jgi:hypothetical protein
MRDSSRGKRTITHNTTHTHTRARTHTSQGTATRALPHEHCHTSNATRALRGRRCHSHLALLTHVSSRIEVTFRTLGRARGGEARAATRGGDQGRKPWAGAGGLGGVGLQHVCAHVSESGEMDGGVARRGACARHAVSKNVVTHDGITSPSSSSVSVEIDRGSVHTHKGACAQKLRTTA